MDNKYKTKIEKNNKILEKTSKLQEKIKKELSIRIPTYIIDANNLENYKETDENIIETKETGTTVILSGIYQNIDIYELNEYIKKEFACKNRH